MQYWNLQRFSPSERYIGLLSHIKTNNKHNELLNKTQKKWIVSTKKIFSFFSFFFFFFFFKSILYSCYNKYGKETYMWIHCRFSVQPTADRLSIVSLLMLCTRNGHTYLLNASLTFLCIQSTFIAFLWHEYIILYEYTFIVWETLRGVVFNVLDCSVSEFEV